MIGIGLICLSLGGLAQMYLILSLYSRVEELEDAACNETSKED